MHKRIQFANFFLQAFFTKHKKSLIFAGVIGFLFSLFFMQTYPIYKEQIAWQHHSIGLVGKVNSQTLPTFIQNQLSIGLTALTATGEATPAAATNWEVDEKGVTYIFHLRKDLVWHDGKRFTAQDVHYALKGASFTPINDTTLKVTLDEPYAPLPVSVSAPLLRGNLQGLGIYKAARVVNEGENIKTLTLHPKSREFPILTYKFYPTLDDAILSFKMGEVERLHEVSGVDNLSSFKSVAISETVQYDRFVGLFFNLQKDVFREKEIRHALAYAIQPIQSQEKAATPISPLSWAYSTKIRLYNYDIDAATKILSKSPLASTSSQLTLSTFPHYIRTAQEIADAWNAAGLHVRVRVESAIPQDFEIFLLAQAIPPDPDQYKFWQSTQEGTNITGYTSPKIDQLLEVGRKTRDKESRKKIYADFQRYLVDDLPVIFLYYPKVYSAQRG